MDEGDIAGLVVELTSGDDRRAESAVKQLSTTGHAALPALRELLASSEADTRWWATWALAEIRDPQVPLLLKEVLHDPALNVRQAAALALRQQPNPEAIPDLVAILHLPPGESDPVLAHLATAALIAAGEAAVPALIEVLEDDSDPARLVAARALAMIGDQRAIPALVSVLESDSAVLEHWAAEGLERMGVGMTFYKPE